MKHFLRAALAVLFLFLATVSSRAQVPTMDAINFKGQTNVFVSRHGIGAPASSCTGLYHYIQDDDTTSGNPVWECQTGTMVHLTGTPSLTANLGVGTNGSGLLTTLWEKGYATVSSVTSVAYDFDRGMGKFDARYTGYDGGVLGPTPGLAMQDLANDLTCYQSMTGLHANVTFPPGLWKIGTPGATTLALPTGAYYRGASGNYNGTATILQATYNNVLALHIASGTTATCSDSNVHTNTLGGGSYEGFAEHGCGDVACSNVSGDSNTYVLGGQNQDSIKIEDSQGFVDLIGAAHNGGNGIEVAGQDTQVRTVWGESNMQAFVFGPWNTSQAYNPATDSFHCNIMLTGLDNTNVGPFETYGNLVAPNASLLHLCSTLWGGGNTNLGHVFSNRDQIGIIRPLGQNSGRWIGGRIDGAGYEGIYNGGTNNSISDVENITSCSQMGSIAKGAVFGPYISGFGSGMTPGTYDIPASTGAAVLTLTVGPGGKATNVVVKTAGSGYVTAPTFTVTGTGGTPATIGATVWAHCDYLENALGSAGNNYVNVHNSYDAFFGADHSTGGIWEFGNSNTLDRGTTGRYERISSANSTNNISVGVTDHRDLLDPASPSGGVTVTGPAPAFLGGNHFRSGDTSPTSWSGPFQFENIMQDLWIYGGNSNTTLPVSAGWKTCSGYDLNLAKPKWYHFFIFQDDVFNPVGTNMIFQEQCDTIYTNQWDVNWLANLSSIAPPEQQGTLDVMGGIAGHALPALSALSIQAGGTPGPNGVGGTYTYVLRIWVGGGTEVTASASVNQCLPLPGFINNPCFQTIHWADPEGWTRWQLYRNSSTDGVATAGLIAESIQTTPQPANPFDGFPDSRVAPINSNTIPNGWLNTTVTGTISNSGTTIPTGTAFPGVPGQRIVDPVGGFYYYCTADDHWVRSTMTFATF